MQKETKLIYFIWAGRAGFKTSAQFFEYWDEHLHDAQYGSFALGPSEYIHASDAFNFLYQWRFG